MIFAVGIAEFFSHLTHVHIDAAIKGREFSSQNFIHQRLPRDYAPGLPQEHLQQTKLYGSQLHRLAVMMHAPRCGVELDVAHTDYIRNRSFAWLDESTPQDSANSGNQLSWIKRLGQIIVGSNLEP